MEGLASDSEEVFVADLAAGSILRSVVRRGSGRGKPRSDRRGLHSFCAKITEWNPDRDQWELYDLTKDFSQANDLAAGMPEKLQAMNDTFTMQATENKVFPVGGAFYTSALDPEEIRSSTLTEWTFFPGQTRIPESMAPKFVSGRSSRAVIQANVPVGTAGVLFCVGGLSGGFTVFIDDGRLCAEYNTLGVYRYKARSKSRFPPATSRLKSNWSTRRRSPRRRRPSFCAQTARKLLGAGLAFGASRLFRLGDLRHRHRSRFAGCARLSRTGALSV